MFPEFISVYSPVCTDTFLGQKNDWCYLLCNIQGAITEMQFFFELLPFELYKQYRGVQYSYGTEILSAFRNSTSKKVCGYY